MVIAAEPLFLKEMGETALREQGPRLRRPGRRVLRRRRVGGRELAPLRLGALRLPQGARARGWACMVSMGAAEVGLHVLHETPALREARQALDSPLAPDGAVRPRPRLLAHPPHVGPEPALHGGAAPRRRRPAPSCSPPSPGRLLPLVRYDLDDEAELLDAAAANRELARQGSDARLERLRPSPCGGAGAARSGATAGACAPRSSRRGSSPRRPTPARSPAASASRPTRAGRCSTCSCARTCAPGPGIEAALRHTVTVAAGAPAEVCIHDYKRATPSTRPAISSTSRLLERRRT